MSEVKVANWAVVEDGVTTNIIVADEEFALACGALPEYPGMAIGEEYAPPEPEAPPEADDSVWEELAAAISEGVNSI